MATARFGRLWTCTKCGRNVSIYESNGSKDGHFTICDDCIPACIPASVRGEDEAEEAFRMAEAKLKAEFEAMKGEAKPSTVSYDHVRYTRIVKLALTSAKACKAACAIARR